MLRAFFIFILVMSLIGKVKTDKEVEKWIIEQKRRVKIIMNLEEA